ncbi:Ribose-phosphate pyrophosphokinase [Aquicella siphonis]|uniref:ribose-phosphate diphosphokinase n=1 Tax=Aquicella siphonis TaxID=254247 RepID=A0A5E4PLJ5_9COXI|nr:ribose-phosphate diphosphokinase [Aquicella siphonis]VVC77183.1 Ribose-phosphate pyrophosphokinase [Aquicella siphonis]
MENAILFSMPDQTQFARMVAEKSTIALGYTEQRKFPDGESYIRIISDVTNKTAIIVCSLNDPNDKLLPLMFMAQTLRELGAKKICLALPYLPYMRQDKRFHPGEAITSILFARFVSKWADALVTIDPHLHRFHSLNEIYSVRPAHVLHATKEIARWIRQNAASPFLIGPDEESRQWVAEIAHQANAPFIICEKARLGDTTVTVSLPELPDLNTVPILIDDIISSGASMLATLRQLIEKGFKQPVCIGVHALFNSTTEQNLRLAGASKIITCNTITHATNEIDITGLIATGIMQLL